MYRIIVLIIFLSCTIVHSIQAQTIELVREKDIYNITNHLQYLEDAQHTIKREDILNGNLKDQFKNYKKKTINFNFSKSTFWLKLKLRYISRSEPVLLEIPWPHIDYIDVYISGKEQILAYKSGRMLDYNDRLYKHKNFVFEIPYDSDELIVYIKIRSDETLIFPIHILDKQAFSQKDRNEEFGFGIYYGIILVMFFYNLLLYLTLRNKSYLYYIFYIITLGLYQLALNGIIFQFWPDKPEWNKSFLPLSQLLLQLTLLWFFKNLLNIDKKSRSDYYTVLFLLATIILSIVMIPFLSYATIIQPLNTLGLLYMIISIVLAMRSYRFGNRTALFFLINWITFFIGGITLSLRNFGILPNNFYTTYSLQIGSTIEMLLLSLALADRVNNMKNELAILNATLEEKVEERTDELLTVLKELRKKNDMMESELELAADVQKCIMPAKQLSLDFLNISIFCEYLTGVGGDYFDIMPTRENQTAILVADVSGHGIPAALLTTMAKISFMNAISHNDDPVEIFKEVDRNISAIITTQNYLTAFLLVISANGDIQYSSAGHRPALIYRRQTNQMEELKTDGLFLGILEKEKDYFYQDSTRAETGDRILLYTDGITEIFNQNEQQWGEEGLIQAFLESIDMSAEQAKDHIISSWQFFMQDMGIIDDSTLLVIDFIGFSA